MDINYIFSHYSSLSFLPDISKWNTNNVTNNVNNNVTNMSSIFNCSSLISLPEISKWNTNKFDNMSGIFYNCSSLSSLPDISKWNINNVANIRDMRDIFFECKNLQYFNI